MACVRATRPALRQLASDRGRCRPPGRSNSGSSHGGPPVWIQLSLRSALRPSDLIGASRLLLQCAKLPNSCHHAYSTSNTEAHLWNYYQTPNVIPETHPNLASVAV